MPCYTVHGEPIMRTNIRMACFSVVFALSILAVDTGAVSGSPYVYQREGDGDEMTVTAEYETAYGTRESRFFGSEGLEQGLRLRFQPWSFLNIEAWGGILVRDGRFKEEALSFEVNWLALNQADHHLDLHLGAGYIHDYRDDHVPRLRAALGRSFGRFDMMMGGVLEIPTSPNRDEVDIMFSLAGSYSVTDWYRQGLEFCVEDIEGLWEPEESEGGAKFLIGPTAHFKVTGSFEIKANLALVLAYLQNQKPPPGVNLGGEMGFMGRIVLGYSF